jgi:hypothetical protein
MDDDGRFRAEEANCLLQLSGGSPKTANSDAVVSAARYNYLSASVYKFIRRLLLTFY